MEVTECDQGDVPYYKELLKKEIICSLWEQIFSFKRSPLFEKGSD